MILAGPDGLDLRKADWCVFDAGAEAPPCSRTNAVLKLHVDVADEETEKASGYEVLTRYDMPKFAPQPFVGSLGGKSTIYDGGRMVLGGDAMSVPLAGGRDVHVVLRTLPSCRVQYERSLKRGSFDYTFRSPMSLYVSVDGCSPHEVSFSISEKGFSDVEFTIPGSLVHEGMNRIAFLGEHVACGYWFYQ